MAYNQKNIEYIKSAGDLQSYIEMERELISTLENSEVEYDTKGENTVAYGHLYGRYWIDTDVGVPYDAVASVRAGTEWSGCWSVASFSGNQRAALAYARAALANQIKRDAGIILAKARARLATLLAAQ